ILGVPVGLWWILDQSFLLEVLYTSICDCVDHLGTSAALCEPRTEAVQVPGVEECLQAAEDTLLAAFRQTLDLFGGEEAEGFDESKDVEVDTNSILLNPVVPLTRYGRTFVARSMSR